MIVADTSALIAILRREPEADDFLRIIVRSGSCLVLSVSVMEASMVLAGRDGDDTSWLGLDQLIARAGIDVVAQDRLLTGIARDAFLRFGKGRHPAGLNMGDCASYALAQSRGLPLLFKGNDFSKTDVVAAA
ncbi:type II toxin-antitoxin system VapC family toxin [Rhodopila globiformis]|uniref:Ribonuclease VapC n=1 Tax=Rhodopila globiformis TaxID=1071 RepID=A0A2S6N255_RHOGL|nr:type II toxin-antitoxin system VapC family toxin [Rhodopila globiformis]PPQ28678.1 VapC toxin family PIN domain ribonuclease [Rhodopila globiformis]